MFWKLIGRMTLWGLIFGLVLGAPYGMLSGTAQAYVEENVLRLGVSSEPISLSEALSYGFYLPFSLGLIFGPFVGIIVGFMDGVVLYLLTAFHHDPPRDARRYRRSAGLLCAATSWVPFLLWPFRDITLDDTLASGQVWLYLALSVAGPSLVFMVVMWWAARRVAGQWYKNESLNPSDRE